MTFHGSYDPPRIPNRGPLRIGFVMQQGSSKGLSLKRFFSKETFPWLPGQKYCIQHLVNQHTKWLSELDSKEEKEEIRTLVMLDGSNQSLSFGFYIQLHPGASSYWNSFISTSGLPPKKSIFFDFKFEVTLFKVIAEYVDHRLGTSITDSGTYLRPCLVPGLTRFIRKSGRTTESRFRSLSLDGEILISHDDGIGDGDEEWKVERSTYPPCPLCDADELLVKIFGKRLTQVSDGDLGKSVANIFMFL